MSKKILSAVLIVFVAQLAYCRVARETPATTATPAAASSFTLDDFFALVNQTGEVIHKGFLDVVGAKNDEEVKSKVSSGLTQVQNSITTSLNNIDKDTKPLQGKAQEFVKAFTDKMSEVGESIKTTNPDLFSGDTTKAKEFFTQSIRTIGDEYNKVNENLKTVAEDISPTVRANLKQIYDIGFKAAGDVKTGIENAIDTVSKKD